MRASQSAEFDDACEDSDLWFRVFSSCVESRFYSLSLDAVVSLKQLYSSAFLRSVRGRRRGARYVVDAGLPAEIRLRHTPSPSELARGGQSFLA